ncbi:MAG TPA: GatB/YqeY domain-containing protein [Candidatus Paceibacterota bacterium]|jgi:uncharacterized protein YqeY|nr:GatB/YqeY domain-containing protein [Candidatus Paceibacterota bacterium]
MSLQLKIREALKGAMKDKDQTALDTLRSALAVFTNEAIALGKPPQEELTDDQVVVVIRKLIKQRRDAIEQYKVGGRADLIAAEQGQIYILEQYLPAPMTDTDIQLIAERKKKELQITDKAKSGILVGAVMKEVGSAADGGTVKKIVEGLFQ